jgi:hypothetical protein
MVFRADNEVLMNRVESLDYQYKSALIYYKAEEEQNDANINII